MPTLSIAFFGDVVGATGLRVFEQAAASIRAQQRAHLILVNGENLRQGSGITPEGYKDLRRAGADAVTLGDHCFKDARIIDTLDDPTKPIARPANLSHRAPGKPISILRHENSNADPATRKPGVPPGTPPIAIITVLGRLFMPLPANDPFECVDRTCQSLAETDPDTLVIVEVHAEATSEKIAMAWHCADRWPGRVIAVVGSHTHVQTSDARIIDHRLAAITDMGMCAGHRGVIGRKVEPVLEGMTRQNPMRYEVADEDPRAHGCLITIDTDQRRPLAIEPLVFVP